VTTATTLICAHRGASAQLPDNSLVAFEAAIAAGADMIEADVRRLADNTLVLSHDPAPAGSTPVRHILLQQRGIWCRAKLEHEQRYRIRADARRQRS
jgi:glycerophosphoryl diester phosphodiesterase